MPGQDAILLDKPASSGINCNHHPSSTVFPIVATQSPTPTSIGTGTGTDSGNGTVVYSTLTSTSYIETVSPSMDDQSTFPPATLDHTSASSTTVTGNQGMTTDRLKIETSPTSPYCAPSPYYSPSTSSSYSPSSYRESSNTPFSTVSQSAPEATMFLQVDHQQKRQQCFPHDFTMTTATPTAAAHDSQGQSHLKRDTPPHQPLSMLSSVASLLPNHQRQHANQGSGCIVSASFVFPLVLKEEKKFIRGCKYTRVGVVPVYALFVLCFFPSCLPFFVPSSFSSALPTNNTNKASKQTKKKVKMHRQINFPHVHIDRSSPP